MIPHSGLHRCLLCQIRRELVSVWFCKEGRDEGGEGEREMVRDKQAVVF